MHVLDQSVTSHRFLITYLSGDDVSLEEFENADGTSVLTADWLVPVKMTLSVEGSEE